MTKEEIQKKSQEKVKAIEALCNQLQITPIGKRFITKEGFIENVVYYVDNENYGAPKSEEKTYE